MTVYRHPFPWLSVKPDREYGLECIHERFELDFECPPSHPAFQRQVKEVVFRAVEVYQRAKKYRWRSDKPVEVDLSDAQFDLYSFGTTDPNAQPIAADQNSLMLVHGRRAYVAKIWFEVPKIPTLEDYVTAETNRLSRINSNDGVEEGMVEPEAIPDQPAVAPITNIEE